MSRFSSHRKKSAASRPGSRRYGRGRATALCAKSPLGFLRKCVDCPHAKLHAHPGPPLCLQAAGQRGFRAGVPGHGGHSAARSRPAHVRQLQLCHQSLSAAFRLSGHGHLHLLLQRPVPPPERNRPYRLLLPHQPAGGPDQPVGRPLHADSAGGGAAHARRAALARAPGRALGFSDLVGPGAALHERRRGGHSLLGNGAHRDLPAGRGSAGRAVLGRLAEHP